MGSAVRFRHCPATVNAKKPNTLPLGIYGPGRPFGKVKFILEA
jgi:hypothetical protein